MARLQDRVVRVGETRGEVALDKLDRSAPIMRSLRRPVRNVSLRSQRDRARHERQMTTSAGTIGSASHGPAERA